jgi:hypothetical protein
MQWPRERNVARQGEMEPSSLMVLLEDDGDVELVVFNGTTVRDYKRATIQFCAPGAGGGVSPRTREALITLMAAIEADNAATPARAGHAT